MYIKQINTYSFILPTGKGYNSFVVRTYEPLPENYKTITITKKKDSYYVSIIYQVEESVLLHNNENILAIDLGIKTLVTGTTTDNKEIIINKFSHKVKHLDELRSKRDKKQKGSRRWRKLNLTFNKRLEQYKNRVEDYLHKSSNFITNKLNYNTIVVGKLNLEGMKSNKTWFNKIICNEWRVKRFVEMLKYKSQKFGKNLVEIDERHTTKTCCKCNNKKEMTLSDRIYKCGCGLTLDRDFNSEFNILKKYCTASAVELQDSTRNNIENMLFDLEIVKFKYI
jgi:putative transposase